MEVNMFENLKFAWYPVLTWKVECGVLKQDGWIFWEKYDLTKTVYAGKRAFRISGVK